MKLPTNRITTMKRDISFALLGLALAGPCTVALGQDILPPCWRGQGGTTYQAWRFLTSGNPATPDAVTNAYGAPAISVAVGDFSDGWFGTWPNSTNLGLWDLGQSGTMQVTIPNQPGVPATSSKFIAVQVAQYIGGVFPNYATVSIAGATQVSSQRQQLEAVPPLGGIYVDQTVWRLEPSPANETVTITAPANGGLIDAVVVDTWASSAATVYVDDSYGAAASCAAVGWPQGSLPADKLIGYTASASLTGGLSLTPAGGTLNVAAGSYAGPATVDRNLTVIPGPGAASISVAGNLALTPGSSLQVGLDGPVAGTGYDSISVAGTVNLGGATLVATCSYGYATGSTLTLIDNDGGDAVTGTFAGLPEGAQVNLSGTIFSISYAGGSGNDVVLSYYNRPPVVGNDMAGAISGWPTTIAFHKLLSNDTDPDGDAFTITSVAAPYATNGTVAISAGNVVYTPPADFIGSNWFTYTVTDARGASATGRVDVAVVAYTGQTLNIASIENLGGGASYRLTIAGVPFYNYDVERAPTVLGPWTNIGSVTCAETGVGVFTDTAPPGPPANSFYRARYP